MTTTPVPAERRPIAARRFALFKSMAASLAAMGVAPNTVSVMSLVFSLAAGGALAATRWAPDGPDRWLCAGAAAGVALRLLANMLDGMIAVENGRRSPTGELYNEVPDRISDAAILIGAGYSEWGTPWVGYVATIAAVLTAYIRAVGKGAGVSGVFGGVMAKQQRMAVVIAVCLFVAAAPAGLRPSLSITLHDAPWSAFSTERAWGVFSFALVVIAIGSVVTCATRLRSIADALNARPPEHHP